MGPMNSKITLTKEKERRKRKSEEEERRRREKSNGLHSLLSFYNGYIGDWRKKNCWTEKGPFGRRNVFKNPARHKMKKKKSIQCLNLYIQN